eukprot:GHVU01227330.1.p1 GENE.GHVU01227330.1~~GHVU01227330.1.p1  ORF type:complete len:684 (+),score=63.37 GHVU01227330.1:97-2148(+)
MATQMMPFGGHNRFSGGMFSTLAPQARNNSGKHEKAFMKGRANGNGGKNTQHYNNNRSGNNSQTEAAPTNNGSHKASGSGQLTGANKRDHDQMKSEKDQDSDRQQPEAKRHNSGANYGSSGANGRQRNDYRSQSQEFSRRGGPNRGGRGGYKGNWQPRNQHNGEGSSRPRDNDSGTAQRTTTPLPPAAASGLRQQGESIDISPSKGAISLCEIRDVRAATELVVRLGPTKLKITVLLDTGAHRSVISTMVVKLLIQEGALFETRKLEQPQMFELAVGAEAVAANFIVELDVWVECEGNALKIMAVPFYVLPEKLPKVFFGMPVLMRLGINPVRHIQEECMKKGVPIPSQPFGTTKEETNTLIASLRPLPKMEQADGSSGSVTISAISAIWEPLPPTEPVRTASEAVGSQSEWVSMEELAPVAELDEISSLLANLRLEDGDDLGVKSAVLELQTTQEDEILRQVRLRVEEALARTGITDPLFCFCFKHLFEHFATTVFRITLFPDDPPVYTAPMEAPLKVGAIPAATRPRRYGRDNDGKLVIWTGMQKEHDWLEDNLWGIWAAAPVLVGKPQPPPEQPPPALPPEPTVMKPVGTSTMSIWERMEPDTVPKQLATILDRKVKEETRRPDGSPLTPVNVTGAPRSVDGDDQIIGGGDCELRAILGIEIIVILFVIIITIVVIAHLQ